MTRRSVMLGFIVGISDLLLISNKQPQRLVLLGLRERHRLQAPYRTAAQIEMRQRGVQVREQGKALPARATST
jgi:hypothetical protein